jgi:hypothetical protein
VTLPRYSRAGLAGVARLTRAKYTVFVEGKIHDAVYYERMLNFEDSLAAAGIRIMRSYEVSDSEVGTGGKTAVLSLHDYFKEQGQLSISTNDMTKHMAFLVDRDFDEFEDSLRDDQHVIYTHSPDVEAEVYRLGNLQRALATVFSLTNDESEALASSIGNFHFELAIRWRQWITMCIAAAPLRSRCEVRPSRPSSINEGTYGAFDAGAYDNHKKSLLRTAEVEHPELELQKITDTVDSVYEAGSYPKLLKGKLIPGFIVFLVSEKHHVNNRDYKAKSHQLTLAMLETADYAEPAKYHRERFIAWDAVMS